MKVFDVYVTRVSRYRIEAENEQAAIDAFFEDPAGPPEEEDEWTTDVRAELRFRVES